MTDTPEAVVLVDAPRGLRRGPRAGTPGAPLTPARRRVLDAVARLGEAGPVTLAAVAADLGGHPNSSRQQVDALVRQGLLGSAPIPGAGRGRPPLGLVLTEPGRRAFTGGAVASDTHDLVGAFATYLVRGGRPAEEARAVGEVWAELAEPSGRPGMAGLVEMLDALGFDPSPARAGDADAVVLRACPLLDLAEAHPEVICQVHRGLVDGVLRRLGATEGVRLVPFAADDGCHLERLA